MEGGNIEERIIKEIGKIKEDIRNDIRQLRDRIDELEGNFQRENRRLRDRISELEDNYESIARGAKVAQRLGPIVHPPVTFAEDSTFCDEYKIATYREKTGL